MTASVCEPKDTSSASSGSAARRLARRLDPSRGGRAWRRAAVTAVASFVLTSVAPVQVAAAAAPPRSPAETARPAPHGAGWAGYEQAGLTGAALAFARATAPPPRATVLAAARPSPGTTAPLPAPGAPPGAARQPTPAPPTSPGTVRRSLPLGAWARVRPEGAAGVSRGSVAWNLPSAKPATLPTCTDNWTGPAGGNWNTPSNWDNGVPSASSIACIPASGSVDLAASPANPIGALELSGSVVVPSAATITVDGPVYVLAGGAVTISGADYCTNSPRPASATVSGDLTNAGTVTLEHLGTCSGGPATLSVSGTLTNVAGGAVDATGCTCGSYFLDGSLLNQGTVTVSEGALFYQQASSTLDNAGALSVSAGTTLTLGAATSLIEDSGGALANSGTVTGAGAITQGDGSTTGNAVVMTGGSIDFSGTGTPAAYFLAPGASATMSGHIVAGVTMTIAAADYCTNSPRDAVMTVTGDSSSAGTIELTHAGNCRGGTAVLAAAPGSTLTSSGTLLLDGVSGSAGGLRLVAGDVVSTGSVYLEIGAAKLEGTGGSYAAGDFVNDGQMTVAAGTSFGVLAGGTFTNGDGAAPGSAGIAVSGSGSSAGTFASAGSFVEGSGTTSGEPLLAGGSLSYTGGGASSVTIPPGENAAFTGSLSAGQTLTIFGADYCAGGYPATLDALTGFTDAGTIDLSYSPNCGGGKPSLVLPAGDTLTIATGGLLESTGTSGAPFGVTGSVLEAAGGTIAVGAGTLGISNPGTGARFETDGTLTTAAGSTLATGAGVQYVDTGGSTDNGGSIVVQGQFVQAAGAISGNAVTVVHGPLDMTGPGAGAFAVPPGSQNVSLVGPIAAGQQLTVTGQDNCNGSYPSSVDAAGSFTNAGTIVVSHVGSCGGGAVSLSFPASSTLTNDGTLDLSGGAGAPVAVVASALLNAGTVNATTGMLSGSISETGRMTASSATFSVSGTTSVAAGGSITSTGSGTIDLRGSTTVASGGTLDAQSGSSIATDALTDSGLVEADLGGTVSAGAFTETPGGVVEVAAAHGATWGSVRVGGSASIGGALRIATDAPPPQNGDAATVMQWSTCSSCRFSRIGGAVIAAGSVYDVSYPSSGVALSVGGSSALQLLGAGAVSLSSPSPLVPGQRLSGSFQVTDIGPGTATVAGGWEDSVYLGTGSTYEPGDALVERVAHASPLGAGQSYTTSIAAEVPPVPPGTYHLIVVPDSAALASDGYADKQAVSSPDVVVSAVPALVPPTPISATVAAGEDLWYQVAVSTEDVGIAVSEPAAGEVEVFAARGRIPSAADHDTASVAGAAVPWVSLPRSSAGVWYVDVHGEDPAGAAGVKVTVTPSNLSLAVSADEPLEASNRGTTTLTLVGSGFGADLAVSLRSGATTLRSGLVSVASSVLAFAPFDLAGAPTGTYDVIVTSGGRSATVARGLTVDSGPAGSLQVTTAGGGPLRFGWVGNVAVTLTNTGGADVAVPVVRLTGTSNCQVAAPGSSTFGPSADIVAPVFPSSSGLPGPQGILAAGRAPPSSSACSPPRSSPTPRSRPRRRS